LLVAAGCWLLGGGRGSRGAGESGTGRAGAGAGAGVLLAAGVIVELWELELVSLVVVAYSLGVS